MTLKPADNLFPDHVQALPPEVREAQLGQRGQVFWLIGLSGSGKTTLAVALERSLQAEGRLVRILDGDVIRGGLNQGLGFSDEDRRENIRRIAEVAKLFAETGVVTICAFITPTESLRHLARDILGDRYHEVYVQASFEACAERDVKGLYAKAKTGQVKAFTGKDSSFEPPVAPDLILDTEAQSPQESLDALRDFVRPRLLLPE